MARLVFLLLVLFWNPILTTRVLMRESDIQWLNTCSPKLKKKRKKNWCIRASLRLSESVFWKRTPWFVGFFFVYLSFSALASRPAHILWALLLTQARDGASGSGSFRTARRVELREDAGVSKKKKRDAPRLQDKYDLVTKHIRFPGQNVRSGGKSKLPSALPRSLSQGGHIALVGPAEQSDVDIDTKHGPSSGSTSPTSTGEPTSKSYSYLADSFPDLISRQIISGTERASMGPLEPEDISEQLPATSQQQGVTSRQNNENLGSLATVGLRSSVAEKLAPALAAKRSKRLHQIAPVAASSPQARPARSKRHAATDARANNEAPPTFNSRDVIVNHYADLVCLALHFALRG